jgi:hypothetical protein
MKRKNWSLIGHTIWLQRTYNEAEDKKTGHDMATWQRSMMDELDRITHGRKSKGEYQTEHAFSETFI